MSLCVGVNGSVVGLLSQHAPGDPGQLVVPYKDFKLSDLMFSRVSSVPVG